MSNGRLHSVGKLHSIFPLLQFLNNNKVSPPCCCDVSVFTYMGVGASVGCTRGFKHACAHMSWHMSYTPVGAWQAGTKHCRREPSWSSSLAGNWPCCTLNCSRKHLQTLGHTKKSLKKYIHRITERNWSLKCVRQKKWGMKLDWQTGLTHLHGYWVYGCSNFKTSLFKHHDRCVVDTGSCKNQTSGDYRRQSRVRSFKPT